MSTGELLAHLSKYWEITCDRLASDQEEYLEILLVVLYHRNQNLFVKSYNPVGLPKGFTAIFSQH